METCEQCRFTYEDATHADVLAGIGRIAREVRDVLGHELASDGGLEALRRRPAPGVWSALEYAGHLRDVFLIQRERVYLAQVEDNPTFVPLYRDERAVLARYNEEDPATTATELVLAADLLGRGLAGLVEAGWARPCRYNVPPVSDVDVTFVGRRTLHEARHHALDIDDVLAGRRDTSGAAR